MNRRWGQNVARPSRKRDAHVFVAAFLQWCRTTGVTGWVDRPKVMALAHECAEAEQLTPPSSMRLFKAMARARVRHTTRELTPGDLAYALKHAAGVRRPRVKCYELGEPRSSFDEGAPIECSTSRRGQTVVRHRTDRGHKVPTLRHTRPHSGESLKLARHVSSAQQRSDVAPVTKP